MRYPSESCHPPQPAVPESVFPVLRSILSRHDLEKDFENCFLTRLPPQSALTKSTALGTIVTRESLPKFWTSMSE
jgi:hypothetical protein